MASPTSTCSEEFDAAETFASSLMDQIDGESVRNMVEVQRDMLSRFEKTNEMLINFNILSANRFAITSQQYRRHTQLMYEMRRDLDSIFKRIRVIKHKLGKAYPDSFKVCGSSEPIFEDEEEFEGMSIDACGSDNDTNNPKSSEKSSDISIDSQGGQVQVLDGEDNPLKNAVTER